VDARTAVVTLSHDPKIDDPALLTALGSEAFYIGALGSTRTHAKRVDRLSGAGIAPRGLNHGANHRAAASPADAALAREVWFDPS